MTPQTTISSVALGEAENPASEPSSSLPPEDTSTFYCQLHAFFPNFRSTFSQPCSHSTSLRHVRLGVPVHDGSSALTSASFLPSAARTMERTPAEETAAVSGFIISLAEKERLQSPNADNQADQGSWAKNASSSIFTSIGQRFLNN